MVNHILSPENDKKLLTDTKETLDSEFQVGEKAVVFYGYDYDEAPMDIIVGCYRF